MEIVIYHCFMNELIGGAQRVTSGYIRLNNRFFDEAKLKMNKHRFSLEEKISYPTVLKYLGDGNIHTISGKVLYAVLVKGMGYSVEELGKMPLCEVFEFVEEVTPE